MGIQNTATSAAVLSQRGAGVGGYNKYLGYLLLTPALLVVALVALYPYLRTLWMSFHDISLIFRTNEWVGLRNYARLLHDASYLNALRNTMVFTLSTVILETLLGLVMAMVMHVGFRGRGIVRAAVLVPWAIPTVVTSMMWSWIYNVDYGILNYLLARIGLLSGPANWLGDPQLAMVAAIIADVWKTTPFIAIILLAGLQGISQDLYEAATIDGAGAFAKFFSITLPLLVPTGLVAVLLRFLDAFRVFALIFVLTNGGPADATEVLSTYAYKVLFSTTDFGYGSAIATSMFLYVLVIAAVFIVFLRPHLAEVE